MLHASRRVWGIDGVGGVPCLEKRHGEGGCWQAHESTHPTPNLGAATVPGVRLWEVEGSSPCNKQGVGWHKGRWQAAGCICHQG